MRWKVTTAVLGLIAILITVGAFGLSHVLANGSPLPGTALTYRPAGSNYIENFSDAASRETAFSDNTNNRQSQLVAGLQQGQQATLRFDPETGSPTFISGEITPSTGGSAYERSTTFFQDNKALFRMTDPAAELTLKRQTDDDLGMTHVHLSQEYQGVPVFAAEISVHFSREGKIVAVNGNYVPEISVNTTPDITVDDAVAAAQADLGYAAPSSSRELPLLVVYAPAGQAPRLTWEITLASDDPPLRTAYLVDAHTGEVAVKIDMLETAKDRRTYTANNDGNELNLPGTLLISEGGSSPDAVVQAAHTNAGLTYDYYMNTFGRDSFNGAGATLVSSAHFGVGYNNAFWNGYQMVYGDGDGIIFSPLSQGKDVVAHELTHAVTQYSADLVYLLQSGALNESYSDVFGAMIDRDDWLMGEDVYTPGTPGDALRSLSSPAAYGQPEHMNNFVQTFDDGGGVHTNSGIPNKAAYNIATAIGKDKMEKIWYRTLTLYLNSGSQFLDARDASVQAATDLYGAGSAEVTATVNGFAAVGLGTAQQGSISGHVTNDEGAPLGDIYVIAYQSDGYGNSWPATNASTDVNGNYTLRGLAGGIYKVEFTDNIHTYVFYNDKANITSADPITVASGTAVTGINAVFSKPGSISGSVTDTAGAPLGGIEVWSCKQKGDGGCDWYNLTYTNADGSYTLAGLSKGDYKVEFGYGSDYALQYYHNKPNLASADIITLAGGAAVTGKDAALHLGGSISGTVTNGTAPLEMIGVVTILPDGIGGWGTWGPDAITDASGNYTIAGLDPGDYKILFLDINGVYLQEYYDNKRDVGSADIVTVATGAAVTGKNAVLSVPNAAKAITAFTIPGQVGTTTINEAAHAIGLTMPYGTDVTALVPTITHTGASVSPHSGVAHDFTDPQIYTVTATDSSTQAYAVMVSVAPNTAAKAITAFTIPGQVGATAINEAAHTIGLTMPYGTNVTALVPTITHTGASVSPLSGAAHDFTTPQTYTVTAADSSTQAYTVTVAVPAVPARDYFWPIYDNLYMQNWVLMANPAGSGKLFDFDLSVAGSPQNLAPFAISGQEAGKVPAGEAITPIIDKLFGGPVKVSSLTGDKAIVSQRSLMGSSMEEVLGTEEGRLSDDFVWPWYDQKTPGYLNWVLVANPSSSGETVRAEIRIAGAPMQNKLSPGAPDYNQYYFDIEPGKNVVPTFPNTMGGPVEVRAYLKGGSWPANARDVIASQRVLSNNGKAFNEVPGIPAGELSSDYLWTWYDSIGAASNSILVANPNEAGGLWYRVTIGTTDYGCYGPLGQNEVAGWSHAGLQTGPVELRTYSDSGCTLAANSVATQRIIWGPSMEEVPGYPQAALGSTYHWTWYDDKYGMNWVLVGNPSPTDTVTAEITFTDKDSGLPVAATYDIPPGHNVFPRFAGKMGGPVKITAHLLGAPGTPRPVIASQRALWNGGYFNEVLGTVLD